MDFANYWFQAPAGGGGYQIGNSLRFRGGQQLQRTAATGNRKTWTWSGWVKPTKLTGARLFGSGSDADSGLGQASIYYSIESLEAFHRLPSTTPSYGTTTLAKYRDPGAWCHVVYIFDTTQATDADRGVFYVNGVRAADTRNPPPQDWDGYVNSAVPVSLGVLPVSSAAYLEGYMSEVHFVDGQALAHTDFGEFNADGVWIPKKVSGVTYGTNGFYLDYSDPADIGADRSGNGNNFTPQGFELTDTSSASYDWVADSPTNNFATLNAIYRSSYVDTNLVYSDGNLKVTSNPNHRGAVANFAVSSGKWYYEATKTSDEMIGWFPAGRSLTNYPGSSAGGVSLHGSGQAYGDGTALNNYSTPNDGSHVIGCAVDFDNEEFYWSIDGTWQNSADPVANTGGFNFPTSCKGVSLVPAFRVRSEKASESIIFNAGNRPFKYTPPTGFKPLSTAELPAVAITNPSEHFQTILDTGANILSAAQATFPNGLWWIKDRVGTNQHQLVDSVRGGNLALQSSSTSKETAYVAPAGNSVAWCWNAGGAPVTNTDGTVSSQVSANPTAGFSIVTYTGNATAGATVGHGLGAAAPKMIIVKTTASTTGWVVGHSNLNNGTNPWQWYLSLETDAGQGTTNLAWNNTAPTSTVFSLGSGSGTNPSATMVAYCWAEVPGYSAFGSYVGNGNASGPFVYCGLRPRWVMVRAYGSTGSWNVLDTARDTYNEAYRALPLNNLNPDATSSGYYNMDILSNGFKIRVSDTNVNRSGTGFIFAAFAEHPFGGSNISPAPAR